MRKKHPTKEERKGAHAEPRWGEGVVWTDGMGTEFTMGEAAELEELPSVNKSRRTQND